MTTIEAVTKIMNAVKFADIVDIGRYKEDYRELVKLVHVDKGGSLEAVAKLNDFKTIHEKGTKYEDEAGEYYSNGYWIKRPYEGLGKQGYLHWSKIRGLGVDHLNKYIPMGAEVASGHITYNFGKRCVPLPMALEGIHVRWVLSRLLEFCMMLETNGFVHCGLNPESVFVDPENHGIMITSFYYVTRTGMRVKSVNGKYMSWYPAGLFSNKIASALVDTELAKKIAIYLLSDKSGVGTRLKGKEDKDLVEFLMTMTPKAFVAYKEYRNILNNNFKTQFHILNI